MKIDRPKKELNHYPGINRLDARGVPRGARTSFGQELSRHSEAESRQRMQQILEELNHLTDRLDRSLNIDDLMLYKRLVKNFLQEATSSAYILNQQRGSNRRGRAILITVKTINEEMERVIEEFIRQKKQPWDVLSILDKIRGMLIDLMI